MKIGIELKKHTAFTFILLFLTLIAGCNNTISQKDVARTYYAGLSLDSPEASVKTFSDAFQREDFFTVFLILSPSTQIRVENNINTLNYKDLIDVENLMEAEEVLVNTPQFQIMSEWEHLGAASIYLFDSIMLAAKQHSVFLIDLGGNMSILNSEPSGEGLGVDIHANIDGIDGTVIFRTEQSPSGRWRIQQVIVPGGNEDLVPWSISNN